MGESNHSMKLFGAVISTDDNGDSIVLQSRNKRRRGSDDEDEEKGISEVEEISEKTEHVEMGESIELFDVVINTENTGDTVVEQSRNKEGNWDEDEHKKFLIGLEKLGKGNWAGIAKKFVRTRTPTQVSSHAQKYFGRQKEEREFRRYKSCVFNINLDEESSNTSPDSVVLRSTNKGNGDEQKGIFEVEEIHKSEKTGDISSSRTKEMGEKSELFDVVISTENNGGEWSEHEHKAFLTGLEKLGKGKWTRIAKEFVPIRTPTQVASHAQKYFAKIDRAASIVESNKL